jgi:hypothetical protein
VHVWTACGHSGERPRCRRNGDLPTRIHERRVDFLHASGVSRSVVCRRQWSAARPPSHAWGFDHPSADFIGIKAVRVRHVYVSGIRQHLRKCRDAHGRVAGVPAKSDGGAVRPVSVCRSLPSRRKCKHRDDLPNRGSG